MSSAAAPGDVVEYQVVKMTYVRELEKEVEKWLKAGWQPLGGVSVGYDTSGQGYSMFAQALVKRAPGS